MSDQITIEQLRIMAQNAGLDLANVELERILPGVQRAKKQAAELVRTIGTSDEPAVIFPPDRQ